MSCFLDGNQIGDDGRNASGRTNLPVYAPALGDNDALERIQAAMAGSAASVIADMAAARIGYWTKFPTELWKVCPRLEGVLHPTTAHVKALRLRAKELAADPCSIQADFRDAHALDLWANRIKAEVVGAAA